MAGYSHQHRFNLLPVASIFGCGRTQLSFQNKWVWQAVTISLFCLLVFFSPPLKAAAPVLSSITTQQPVTCILLSHRTALEMRQNPINVDGWGQEVFSSSASARRNEAFLVQLKQFSWIVGTWKHVERNIYESWRWSLDSTRLLGLSYSIKEGDTTILERLHISVDATGLYFMADVPENGKPIRFSLKPQSPNSFFAENQEHDYPTYIKYKLEAPGKLKAEIGNAEKSQQFEFERFSTSSQ